MENKGKTIFVTGANGLVGIPTIEKCIDEGAANIVAVDINVGPELIKLQNIYNNIQVRKVDLTASEECARLFNEQNKIDIVLHIAGIKGSPTRTKTKPADYLIPMLQFNTNVMKYAQQANVEWFVYLSSVGVYAPADVMEEDTVWETFPSKNDWHPGWAKRIGELTLDALKIQYGWDKWTIIRPSNIYGLNDNFAPDATVISSNVWKLLNVPGDEIICWGDGTARRDFVFANDVAHATVEAVKQEVKDVINFGCGEAVSIKDMIEILVDVYKEVSGEQKKIVWDTTKPNGDLLRCLSSEKQKKYNLLPQTSLREGLKKTVTDYFTKNSFELNLKRKIALNDRGYYIGNIKEIFPDEEELKKLSQACYEMAKPENRSKHFQYRIDIGGITYSKDSHVPISEIDNRRKYIKDNDMEVIQQWYESVQYGDYGHIQNRVSQAVIKATQGIYNDVDTNSVATAPLLSLYEDGDFIQPHRDGQNESRICIFLLYMSDPKKYNQSGGKLIIKDDGEIYDEVEPVLGNYVILDFTKHNVNHAVESVKNGFQRLCFLCIVNDKTKEK